ncbi:MAG: hypothetical protein ABFQ95_07130 [Pseudomonadota bacterium]
MPRRFNLCLILSTGLIYSSSSLGVIPKESQCPSVADFKKILNAKRNHDDPFQPITDTKGRRWIVMQRFKKATQDGIDELTIEPQEQTTKLPITPSKARICNYLAKSEDGTLLDQAKIVEAREQSSTR